MNIKDMSTVDLEAELRRRREEELARIQREKENKMQQIQILTGSPLVMEFLKLLLPDHSRTTCITDEEAVNPDRCTRCAVFYALEMQDMEVLYRLRIHLS